MMEHFFDPEWVKEAGNAETLDWWLNRMTTGRYATVPIPAHDVRFVDPSSRCRPYATVRTSFIQRQSNSGTLIPCLCYKVSNFEPLANST